MTAAATSALDGGSYVGGRTGNLGLLMLLILIIYLFMFFWIGTD